MTKSSKALSRDSFLPSFSPQASRVSSRRGSLAFSWFPTSNTARRSLKSFHPRPTVCKYLAQKTFFSAAVVVGYEKKKKSSLRSVFVLMCLITAGYVLHRTFSASSCSSLSWRRKKSKYEPSIGTSDQSGSEKCMRVRFYRSTGLSSLRLCLMVPAVWSAICCAPKSVTRSLF